ncbi:DUF2975 domain-containing protein [Erythrobacter insulae]|uniref:DUF2975 domain-containing protein n=2 Tax=Erythrobacter insulae TaxID=2584124 RepID=A0A547PC10_9SPHN|nr:DUF2975 domain-containing protein [Erythrobacter insulae]
MPDSRAERGKTMQTQFNDPLLLAGKVLTFLMQGALALGGALVAIMIPVVIFFQDEINSEITAEQADIVTKLPIMPLIGLFALILVAVALAFLFFGKLRAIIGTVGERDPFVPENADRLSFMAWTMLSIQVLMIPLAGLALIVATWADAAGHEKVTVDAGLNLTGLLLVVVLFILARVFKHGAAMREDLEGTV